MMRKYVAVLVGIALAISLVFVGCNEGDNDPVSPTDSMNLFTGTFQWEGVSSSTGANLISTFTLIQNGSAITGNLVFTGISDCCTASCTASVTGTANSTSAVLSLQTCEDTCQGNNCGSYRVGPIVGDFSVNLIDNNGILRFNRTLSDHTRIL